MWMSDVHSVGGYVFAAGLFGLGLVGWQVLLALVIGITLVNLGMNWIGYAGQRTGVPCPVLARVSFGVSRRCCLTSATFPDSYRIVAVRLGNFWGLPVNFIAFSVVSVVVTADSIAVYDKAIFDPVELVQRMDNTVVSVLGAITFAIATIGINVVANFVSPAYDLANLAPKHIDFKLGGVITAIAALLVMPWKVYGSSIAVQYFLGGLAAFLGPLFGITIADYYLRRRGRVQVDDLYRADERAAYYHRRGWNPKALAAFVPAAAVAAAVALIPASVVPPCGTPAPFSWFIGAVLGSAAYLAITTQAGETGPEPAAEPATATA